MVEFVRVVQITDTHLFADPAQKLMGVTTQLSFAAVLAVLQAQPWQPDCLLLTGDLAQDETEATYTRLAESLVPIRAPSYWLAGNHDAYPAMQAKLCGATLRPEKQAYLGAHWQVILLNSQVPGEVWGRLAQSELDFLLSCLTSAPQRYALICLHHPPVTVGSAWIDAQLLANATELLALLQQFPRVKIILCGHVHQEFNGQRQNIAIHTTPSTCFQFKPQASKFTLDSLPPGLRYLELYADGSYQTQVLRAENFTARDEVNAMATGY